MSDLAKIWVIGSVGFLMGETGNVNLLICFLVVSAVSFILSLLSITRFVIHQNDVNKYFKNENKTI